MDEYIDLYLGDIEDTYIWDPVCYLSFPLKIFHRWKSGKSHEIMNSPAIPMPRSPEDSQQGPWTIFYL